MDYRLAPLVPDDRAAIARHLLSLDAEDHALRFGVYVSDAVLTAYVGSLNFDRDAAEGPGPTGG